MKIGDVFREFGKDYRADNRLAPHIRKSMVMIEKCGTGELGSHQLECDSCGSKYVSFLFEDETIMRITLTRNLGPEV